MGMRTYGLFEVMIPVESVEKAAPETYIQIHAMMERYGVTLYDLAGINMNGWDWVDYDISDNEDEEVVGKRFEKLLKKLATESEKNIGL